MLPRCFLRGGALPVDHQTNHHALPRLANQRIREAVADDAGPKAELVDVDRRRRRFDVGEHRWIERRALDQDLRGGRAALLEGERQVTEGDRAGKQPLGMGAKRLVGNRDAERLRAYDCRLG